MRAMSAPVATPTTPTTHSDNEECCRERRVQTQVDEFASQLEPFGSSQLRPVPNTKKSRINRPMNEFGGADLLSLDLLRRLLATLSLFVCSVLRRTLSGFVGVFWFRNGTQTERPTTKRAEADYNRVVVVEVCAQRNALELKR